MARLQRTLRNEFPSQNPARVGKTDVTYVYMNLDTFATYHIIIPLEEDTEAHVREELEAAAKRAAAAGPPQIEIM